MQGRSKRNFTHGEFRENWGSRPAQPSSVRGCDCKPGSAIDKQSTYRYNDDKRRCGMTLQNFLDEKNITKDQLSKDSNASETGLPKDKRYLECGLPPYLQKSIESMKRSWEIVDSGKRDLHWDIYWCDLNADTNSAEVDQVISPEQAWYLREKYLRMERS